MTKETKQQRSHYEWPIEEAICAHPEDLNSGYAGALAIREFNFRGVGFPDVLLLPQSGPHRLVIVEAKRSTSLDASTGQVVDQLLNYFKACLLFGSKGLSLLAEFIKQEPSRAHDKNHVRPKELVTDGTKSPQVYSRMFEGEALSPEEIGLFIALDGPPSDRLRHAIATARGERNVDIGFAELVGRRMRITT